MLYFPHFSSSFLLFFLHNIKPAAAQLLSDGPARPMLFWKWPAPCSSRHNTHPFPVPSLFYSLSLSHASIETHTHILSLTHTHTAQSCSVYWRCFDSTWLTPLSSLSLPLRPEEEAHSSFLTEFWLFHLFFGSKGFFRYKVRSDFGRFLLFFVTIRPFSCADILGGPCLCTFCSIFLDLTTGKEALSCSIINKPSLTFSLHF